MKSTPGDLAPWSLSLATLLALFVTFTSATPINRQVGISENVFITVQNDTYGIEQRVCSIDSMTYGDGETIPTSSPCEHCICRPPGFACTIISCEYRPGCKAFKRSNQCCPEYQCECEKDGRIYQNGEKIMDSNNPCEICYCQGGEIVCAVIDCYWRSDCQPRYIENRCCPLYDHCPPPSNSGPFMRPTIPTTTTASGFPWYNLSSAVYEVTDRPNPTPVPLFLTSRSTTPEEPSTTPKMEPELVVATEKSPVEINIMATAQEDSQDSENFVASNIVEKEAEAAPQQEQPAPIVIVESSPVVPDRPVVVESSPIFTSDSVSLLDSPSTTIFQAPAIAISIVPSPVEQIMITQEPEILSQIIPESEPEAVVTSGNNSVAAVEQQPEELATTSVPLAESVEPSTATESLPNLSSSVAEETETEIVSVVSSTELPVSVVESSESSTVHSSLNIEDPVFSPEPEPEITTQIPVSSSSPSEEPVVVNNDAPADEVTTMRVVPEVNTETEPQHLDDAVMILADSAPDVPESTTAVVDVVVSQETVTNEPEEINPAPSVVSLIMPTVEENETFDSQVEVTTVSSVASQTVNQEDEIQNDPSIVINDDAPESTTTVFEPIVAEEVESTFKPEVVATESSTLLPINSQSDQAPISQDIPETIMVDVESIPATTFPSVAEEVVPTTLSPVIEPDFPASDDQIANEPEIFPHTTEISSSPSSVSSQVPEEEVEVTTTAPISTVVNIENQNEEAIIHDAHVVPIELPVSEDSPTIPLAINNEINPIDGETFEIIPPQNNHIENVPEVQNQVMDRQPENSKNEVDSQSDRNSDDDTIEIFPAAVNSSPESDNSNVKPEIDSTTFKTIMPMQDDAVVILAADADNEQQIGADENDEEIHTDDQHGSSNLDETESFTTTQKPSMLLHSETEVKQNDDAKHSEDVVTTQSTVNDDEVPLNDEAVPETTQVNHAAAAEEEAVHSDDITTTQPLPQNDEPLMEDIPVPTTLSPVNKVIQVVKKTEENDDGTQNKFRLDLSAFDDSGEVEGTQSTVTGSPNEVVFDEIPQVPTHPPTQQLVEEDAIKLRNDDEGHNGHAQSNAAETSPTTVLPIVNDQKENRDDIDEVTTQKSRHVGDEVEPIQNFEFDAVETTSRPNSERSDLVGLQQETVEVIPTTVRPNSENLLRHDAETTMRSNGEVNDFVEVSTGSSSGFGAEYREEFVPTTMRDGSNYKSENIAEDSTTVKTSVFDDDAVDPTTHGSENKAKSEPIIISKINEEATTFETVAVNDDVEEVTTVASTVIINATTTSQTTSQQTPVSRIVSIDQMIIPKTGVSVPSVSDDIVKPKSDLGRSDIVLEGESDSWLAQTAIKNRQLQGLFPSSRSSQKRLFRSRQPRDAEGSHPFKFKTQIKKTKKVTTNKPVKKPHFPNRSFGTQN